LVVQAATVDQSENQAEALKQSLENHLAEIREGGLRAQVWASVQAGRDLIALKHLCRHGQFDAAKLAKGLNRTSAHRFISLANSPYFSQCETFDEVGEVIDREEWRSMRNILDSHSLAGSGKAKKTTVDVTVEDVEMCRYSGGYLFRGSVCGDHQVTGDRIEVAMETTDPTLARRLRDFGYRLLWGIKGKDGKPILCERTHEKWQAYKAEEGQVPAAPLEDPSEGKPSATAIISRVIRQIDALNMREEFAPIMPALQEYLEEATS
jgi:hypothetical protein